MMKKEYKKIIFIVSAIIIIFVAIVFILRFLEINRKENEKKQWESIEAEETVHKVLRSELNLALDEVFCFLIEDDNGFIEWDDFLTEHFKDKYKTKNDIMPEIDKYKLDYHWYSPMYGESGLCRFDFLPNDKNDSTHAISYYYKFDTTDDHQLNDFELVKTVDRDPKTWKRLDGKGEFANEELKEYLKYYTTEPDNFYTDTNVTADFDATLGNSVSRDKEYRKYKNIPLTSDFQVINRPEPTRDFAFSVKGFKIMMKYENDTKYYRMDFDIDDQGQFKKIEYVEISREEYLKQ